MLSIGIFSAIGLLLFAGAFISRRRFGLLGLALAAGATLSTIWSYDAGLIVSGAGIVPNGVITQAVTQSLVVLLPAILLLFHGYSYRSLHGRVIGALLFMLLALAFLVEPIGYALPLEGLSADVYTWLGANKNMIISIGVVFAIVDIFFTKPAALSEKKKR